ncbi:hypothetical protein D3C78_1204100 [compost metagenome]
MLCIAGFVPQRFLTFVAHGMQQGLKEGISIVDGLIRSIAYLIFSRVVSNQYPNLCCVLGPGTATKFAIECSLTDFYTQVAKHICIKSQRSQCQAFGVDVAQCVEVQTLGCTDRLHFELELSRLGFETQGEPKFLLDMLMLRGRSACHDVFHNLGRQLGEVAEQ